MPAAPPVAPATDPGEVSADSSAVPVKKSEAARTTSSPTSPTERTAKPAPPATAPTKGEGTRASAAAPTASSDAAGAFTLSGTIELTAGGDQVPAAGDLAEAAVYFVPAGGAPKLKPGLFRIYTHHKQFDPQSLVVPLGSTVSFPNQDSILHNIFSVSPAANFDLGLYGAGASTDYTFKKSGLVRVNCNVHHAMQADILVIDTPWFAHPDKNGRFELAGLPSGPGKLMIWSPRAAIQSQALTIPAAPVSARIVVTKPRVEQHLNKENKSY